MIALHELMATGVTAFSRSSLPICIPRDHCQSLRESNTPASSVRTLHSAFSVLAHKPGKNDADVVSVNGLSAVSLSSTDGADLQAFLADLKRVKKPFSMV